MIALETGGWLGTSAVFAFSGKLTDSSRCSGAVAMCVCLLNFELNTSAHLHVQGYVYIKLKNCHLIHLPVATKRLYVYYLLLL